MRCPMSARIILALLVALSLPPVFAQSPLDSDLLKMAREGADSLVKLLLSAGADVNARDENGQTPLMLAAAEGHNETVAALLDAGADVQAKDNDGKTASLLAGEKGHAEIVQILGIDPKDRQLWEKDTVAGTQAYQQGRYGQAEKSWLAAVEQAKNFGDENVFLGVSLNNLAFLYRNQGKYAEAEPLHQRALAIREKVLGPEHPEVATSLNNLAMLYRAQGKDAEAEPLLQRSLAIREKALGAEHPDVAQSLENYAVLLRKMDRNAEAEKLEERARVIRAIVR